MRAARAALAAGVVVAGLVTACVAVARAAGSPVVARHGGTLRHGTAWAFLGLLAAAFAVYVVALALVRRRLPALPAVLALAAAIQLAPLGTPLLLSTDAWTYWAYGRIAAEHGRNPYVDRPSAFPTDPAYGRMGADWHERTSVYGPAFTLASEPIAKAAGSSAAAAAWIYRSLAAAAILAAAMLAARLSRVPAAAAAMVGWNPVLAVHLAGGGHNDAWVAAAVLAALALAAARRGGAAGSAWVLAIGLKWLPAVFLGLELIRGRGRPGARLAGGLLGSGAALAAAATWRYGTHWLGALAPLADNARRETRYALPQRAQELGLPRAVALALAAAALAAGLAWLARSAWRGRVRHGLAACLILLTTPYLAVWYLAWAVPLAAADDDDRAGRLLALALCAYLLPQTIVR